VFQGKKKVICEEGLGHAFVRKWWGNSLGKSEKKNVKGSYHITFHQSRSWVKSTFAAALAAKANLQDMDLKPEMPHVF